MGKLLPTLKRVGKLWAVLFFMAAAPIVSFILMIVAFAALLTGYLLFFALPVVALFFYAWFKIYVITARYIRSQLVTPIPTDVDNAKIKN